MGADKGGGVEDSSIGVSGVVPYLLLLPGVLILPFFSKGFRVICLCRCSQNSQMPFFFSQSKKTGTKFIIAYKVI